MSDHHEHAVGVHGMLLFGDEAVYLSHLPMFAPPHNFQVILEVALDDAGRQAISSDREQDREDYSTFVPEPFPITELDPGEGTPQASIKGAIHRGHFERGGPLLAEDVVATVREVVHFRELALDDQRDAERDLTYLCFGRPGALYLAHEVTAQPDFDQVLRVRLIPGTGSDQAGRPLPDDVAAMGFDRAQPVAFRDRSDTPTGRLSAHEVVEGFFSQTVTPSGFHGFATEVETGAELYLEIGELS